MDNKPTTTALYTINHSKSDPEATTRLKESLERLIQIGDQSSIQNKRVNGKPVLKRIK